MSKNEIRSGETGISSEPSINSKAKKSSSQEGILNRVRQHWANLTSAAGLLSMAIVSPIDLPVKPGIQPQQAISSSSDLGYTPLFPHGEMVKYVHDDHEFGQIDNLNVREELPKLDSKQFVTYSGGGFSATRIHGDGAPTDLSYMIVGQGYNDQQLLDSAQTYVSNLLSVDPFKSVPDKFSISVLHTQGTPDLGVNLTGDVKDVMGDSQKVNKLIDQLHQGLGQFQETRMFVNNSTSIAAAEYADPNQPTIYSYGALTEGRLRFHLLRGGVAHMEGHATGGLGEGNYSANHWGNEPNVYNNCLTPDQIPVRWKGIPGAPTGPSPEIEGCGNAKTGAFRDAVVDWMSNISKATSYGPVTLWQLNNRINGAPAIYYTPTLLEPASGITTNRLGADLKFKPSIGTEQFQVQVIPFNYDGPGINLIIGDQKAVQAGIFNILEPRIGEGNYTMLPGMTYTWRIRGTSVKGPVGENDPVWGNWAERKFRTPDSSASTIKLPITLSEVNTNPTPFRWVDTNRSIFYYEVQVSGDNRFDVNPDTATSFVWWNLVHGGITNNSWTPPTELEPNTTYFWRVRPRIQGDGTPVDWGSTWVVKIGPDGHSYRVSQVELDANGKQSLVTAYEYNAPKAQAMTESQADNQVNIKLEGNDCLMDFFPQRRLGINDILDPSCYRLMGDRVTLKPGNISIRGFDKENAYIPNRQERRKQAREARKNTYRAA